MPPTGKVSPAEGEEIFARGPLNDVAGCYFLMGEALKALYRLDEAKEAYKGAQKFSAARVWDPNGWFWEPALKASDRLYKLN